MRYVLLFFMTCLLASTAGAISGIGGGVIIKPVLEVFPGYGVEVISFLSGCAVLSMALVSLLREGKRDGRFEFRKGTFLAAGSVVGGIAGKLAFDALGGGRLGLVQAAVLCLMMAGLLVYQGVKKRLHPKDLRNGGICVLLGGMMGLFSAFLGIGGGSFNLVVLTYFFGMDDKKAAAHSIYVILFSQAASLALTLAFGNVPEYPWPLLTAVICGGVGGGLFGSALRRRMSHRSIGRLYTALLVFVLLVSMRNLVAYL